ncbi:sigma-70 family RNA polymerase sigma factor [Neorhodopirellula pilleata]|uniref:RNA polymerase sigma-35 factor n=1 Tax=Neorhodopirellula pilleata TaxID=2714738 RepID=A0A5C6AE63_9BACT|nr:sigma-70 family RNA polymerase sigma factor [Neorhodopirellula pilleata]TWT97475.1 RNA polymerase sigma-35 factor precursor [Neorhodopirellula pilleata]
MVLLTAQEERAAFLRLAELRENDSRDAEQVRHRIIESNLRLVFSIAKRYAQPKTDEFDEFVSVGNAALVRAVDMFEPHRGWRFSTYAYKAIQRAIFGVYRQDRRRRQRIVSGEFEFAETLLGDDGDEVRRLHQAKLIRRNANRLMKKLDDRDRAIVMSRFGINRSESGLAFRKIADEIGISTTRTVQLFHRSMKLMRQAAEELRIDHQIEVA